MPYRFTFDLSNVPRFFFTELAMVNHQTGMHKAVLKTSLEIIKKFKIEEATGLNLNDAVLLMHDFIEVQSANMIERNKFLKTKKRALVLPHCARKYLDSRCKAVFDTSVPTYRCSHCSGDCLVNQSDKLATEKGYDVYVLPGGSCIPKIMKSTKYEGVVGVACGEEIKTLTPLLTSMDVVAQAIPLIKNGCANTAFNLDTLVKVL